ncbi:Endoplasmic reticulum aminopeptidase 1 [Thelohanellus kitauei]|uniref:Endoplasmic reticulum aminopeptidase 1 n=1 Tax=Thelohanellus kitauei TaxID=669202 RepID=A0A0C2JGN3_THEKT|nr:Endoplasmic reticulum aminopeptidase 1 [Thelohanellus kitauei]
MCFSNHVARDILRLVINSIFLIIILLTLYFSIAQFVKEVPNDIVLCNYGPKNNELVKSRRLPKNVQPHTYFLSYVFDENMETYKASTDINLTIVAPTQTIVFHSDNHKVISMTLNRNQEFESNTRNTEISEICYIKETQMMIVRLSREMAVGEQATLSIMFQGIVSGSLNGIYSSVYVSKTNETKKIISTQFQPDFARTAFPCFDEPSFKAVFFIKLSFPKTYKALSNAATLKQVRDFLTKDLINNTTLSVEFKPTVRMSSYLVAFAIHDFDSISASTKSGIKVNVWLPRDSIEHGKFAAELAPKVLETFEMLFNIPYQLEKLGL